MMANPTHSLRRKTHIQGAEGCRFFLNDIEVDSVRLEVQNGLIYYDGSGLNPQEAEIQAAGLAGVQIGTDGHRRAILAVVPWVSPSMQRLRSALRLSF